MKFRPCIDIHDGKVKQIVGSTLGGGVAENFVSPNDAAYYAELYKNEGLSGGHIALLDQKISSIQAAKRALAAFPQGMQLGGGVNADNAQDYLESGASHVIVTSFVFTNGELDYQRLGDISRITGKNRLVLDLSCRRRGNDYVVVTNRWQTFTSTRLSLELLQELSQFCDEFLIHGVDVEGKKAGIDEGLLALLSPWEGCPVTYAGGIRSMEDIELIGKAGAGRIDFTVGSALDIFGGKLSLGAVRNQ